MTNREKYLKNLTNAKLAKLIMQDCELCPIKNKCNSNVIANDVCINPIVEWLERKTKNNNKTNKNSNDFSADAMFEKLGYKIDKEYENPISILYNNAEIGQILIDKVTLHFGKRRNKKGVSMLITEAEDKAIHKKIEELKQ